MIVVGYGTNNWTWSTKEELTADCNAFYQNLAETYPQAKIYALTPIWRKDSTEPSKAGDFADVPKIIQAATKKYANITVLPAIDFVPHEERFYADLKVHPNDLGFAEYYQNLIKYITL